MVDTIKLNTFSIKPQDTFCKDGGFQCFNTKVIEL